MNFVIADINSGDEKKNKAQGDLEDACDQLGIARIIESPSGDNRSISIYFGPATSNTIPLARAVQQLAKKQKISVDSILTHPQNMGKIRLTGETYEYCEYPEKVDYYTHNNSFNNRTTLSPDIVGFDDYSSNKMLTSAILRTTDINIPREIFFKASRNNRYDWGEDDSVNDELVDKGIAHDREQVLKFFEQIGKDKKIVVKPVDGFCGEDVHILKYTDIDDRFSYDYLSHNENYVVQEKIESYPIYINNIKKDWNLRVLVTYDYEAQQYITSGIIGRIDDDGKAVNLSQSADYISLKEIGKLAGWDRSVISTIEEKIKQTATHTISKFTARLKKKSHPDISIGSINTKNFLNFDFMKSLSTANEVYNEQNIAGIDIIIDEQMEPYVIEVNGNNSGGMYSLLKLESIKSLYPIAQSILTKIVLSKEAEKKKHPKNWLGGIANYMEFIK